MGAAGRIALSFGVAVAMLTVNAWLMARGTPIGIRFATAVAIGVGYALAIVAWQRHRAQR